MISSSHLFLGLPCLLVPGTISIRMRLGRRMLLILQTWPNQDRCDSVMWARILLCLNLQEEILKRTWLQWLNVGVTMGQAKSLVNGNSWNGYVLGHSGQRTSVLCAKVAWNYHIREAYSALKITCIFFLTNSSHKIMLFIHVYSSLWGSCIYWT